MASTISNNRTNNWSKLSRAWAPHFHPSSTVATANNSSPTSSSIQHAIQRTLPLLSDDPTAVPFICRYRSDIISPLTTKQIHQLSDIIQKYDSLSSLRDKILDKLQQQDGGGDYRRTIQRVETSFSKSELDDIYAPYKPPSKGSLEDRINEEFPQLVSTVDEVWNTKAFNNKQLLKQLKPVDKVVTLFANRIASDVDVMDALMSYSERFCRIQVKQASSGDKKKASKDSGSSKKSSSSSFETYHDYSNKVTNLRDHQVLAIRRGVAEKKLKLSFDMDETRIDRIIEQSAFAAKIYHPLYTDARKDAWSRLLKKRITARLWKDVSKRAEEQSIHVFCDNLSKALLAPPPIMKQHKALLSMDPGFQAGIKCAVLTNEGKVVSLDTVKFLGTANKESGKKMLVSLLETVKKMSGNSSNVVLVTLGNGHGTREARSLLQEATAEVDDIEVDVQLVTEAGASVWSVTDLANEEFPNEPPAAIASVSIGRRYVMLSCYVLSV